MSNKLNLRNLWVVYYLKAFMLDGWEVVHSDAIIIILFQHVKLPYIDKGTIVKLKVTIIICGCQMSITHINMIDGYGERGNYCIQAYASTIQHKNLAPYKFAGDSPQMTWTTLIRGVWS